MKCTETKEYMAQHHPDILLVAPQVPNYPMEAITLLRETVSEVVNKYPNAQLGYIGSSMGGFMSTNLMQDFPGRAVLVNPAVTPHILLHDYLGEHEHPYTGKSFTLTKQHMSELESLLVPKLQAPENFWVLLQEGDETLDYKEAVEKYSAGNVTVEKGGDHSFQGYGNYLQRIFQFLYPE
ncbi:YqiA/YcfP family alpha/beta fold hydrolase [Paraneptunicella aestuarii]|uniref:YqiA/YcfP family alpha/beta fold hydrolase n=1 Tax=Paraneptunicella aestuarii TaxID=2831148 RepID=UPI001E568900|nr:YqiA/YcfP family alpha/beta fold hydrolase [Paraneptunicella aestuarii]